MQGRASLTCVFACRFPTQTPVSVMLCGLAASACSVIGVTAAFLRCSARHGPSLSLHTAACVHSTRRACMMRCSLDVDLSKQLRPRKQPSPAQAAASQFAPGDSLLIIPTSSSCSPLFYLHSLQNAARMLSDVRALQDPEGSSRGCHVQAPQAQKQQRGGMQSSSGYCTSAASRAAHLRGWLQPRGSPGDGSAPAGFRSGCSHATP